MSGRLLVIRGGALGDFILTLPAIRLLRENFPNCALDILGYRHIAILAEGRYYASATRSIEYGPLAGFFNPKGSLDRDLYVYFAGFQQVISYLYDPDGLFEDGLRRAGVRNLISASPKISETEHAARQLARPLEQLALWLEDPAARIKHGKALAAALCFVGLSGQRTFASATLRRVGPDAERVVRHLRRHLRPGPTRACCA